MATTNVEETPQSATEPTSKAKSGGTRWGAFDNFTYTRSVCLISR